MASLARRMTDVDPIIIPDYQRKHVWTNVQSSRFIGFLAEGGTVPPLFVQRWKDSLIPDELLDGLQRVTAIQAFVAGKIPMELSDGTQVFLSDLSPQDRKLLTGHAGPMLSIQYIQCETRVAVLQMYLRLNRGGTAHTDAEIAHVENLLALAQNQ